MDVKEDHPPPAGRFQAEVRLYLEPVNGAAARWATLPLPKRARRRGARRGGLPGDRARASCSSSSSSTTRAAEKLAFVGTHVAKRHHTLADLLPVLAPPRGCRRRPAARRVRGGRVRDAGALRAAPRGRTLKEASCRAATSSCFQVDPPQPARRAGDAASRRRRSTRRPRRRDGAGGRSDARGGGGGGAAARCSRWRASRCSRSRQFFEHVKNRVVVHLHKLPPQQSHGQGSCARRSARCRSRWTSGGRYDQTVTRAARAGLKANPEHVRLTMHNPYSDLPKPQPIKFRGVETLLDMLTSFQKSTDILFYEVLDIPLREYEAKKALKVSWHNGAGRRGRVLNLLLDREATVGRALEGRSARARRRSRRAIKARPPATGAAAQAAHDGGLQPPHLQDLQRGRRDRVDQRPVLDDPRRGGAARGAEPGAPTTSSSTRATSTATRA